MRWRYESSAADIADVADEANVGDVAEVADEADIADVVDEDDAVGDNSAVDAAVVVDSDVLMVVGSDVLMVVVEIVVNDCTNKSFGGIQLAIASEINWSSSIVVDWISLWYDDAGCIVSIEFISVISDLNAVVGVVDVGDVIDVGCVGGVSCDFNFFFGGCCALNLSVFCGFW